MKPPSMENQHYYDLFSKTYEDERHDGYHLLIDDLESELVLPHARNKDVLEVGCGTGLILNRVATVAASHVGLDLSEGMLEHARSRGLCTIQGSATELPFDEASFDLVYSFKVLSHVRDLSRALAEMARVTRPGGRVFIELYNRHSIRYLLRRLRGGRSIGEGVDDNQVFFQFLSPAEMRKCVPEELVLERTHGVRIFTVLPGMVSWPIIGEGLRALERVGRTSPLARFGGFLVLECVRQPAF